MGAVQGTGVVLGGSDLVRRRWVMEKLLQMSYKSFWAPYMGESHDSIVYHAKNMNAKDGHTVVFDFDGHLVNAPVRGKETAYGRGEQKRKFSDKVTVERFRYTVDNGDEFDGVNIGDININQHSDSIMKLADLYYRSKDQSIFDVGQLKATHAINLSTFTFDDALDVENIIKTGEGYDTGDKRLPLKPFMMSDGRPVWLVVIDSPIKNRFLKSTGAQNFFREADVRGNGNRVIKGVIGKVGNFLFVEADTFFGTSKGTAGSGLVTGDYANPDNSSIQWAGLRQYKGTLGTPALWTGESGFDASSDTTVSRGLILGAGAFQVGMGMMPDYHYQPSQDFGIKSESALEVWCNTRVTNLTEENQDYDVNVAGISNGVIALDVQI